MIIGNNLPSGIERVTVDGEKVKESLKLYNYNKSIYLEKKDNNYIYLDNVSFSDHSILIIKQHKTTSEKIFTYYDPKNNSFTNIPSPLNNIIYYEIQESNGKKFICQHGIINDESLLIIYEFMSDTYSWNKYCEIIIPPISFGNYRSCLIDDENNQILFLIFNYGYYLYAYDLNSNNQTLIYTHTVNYSDYYSTGCATNIIKNKNNFYVMTSFDDNFENEILFQKISYLPDTKTFLEPETLRIPSSRSFRSNLYQYNNCLYFTVGNKILIYDEINNLWSDYLTLPNSDIYYYQKNNSLNQPVLFCNEYHNTIYFLKNNSSIIQLEYSTDLIKTNHFVLYLYPLQYLITLEGNSSYAYLLPVDDNEGQKIVSNINLINI